MCANKTMYSDYFTDQDIKPEYIKEFISLFDGWLGEDNLYKLDEVKENEWCKFNILAQLIFDSYQLFIPNKNNKTCIHVDNINLITSTYKEAMDKEPSQFTKIIIPELHCVITEDWDFTSILWHKNNSAIEKLAPLIKQAGLYHFND